MKILKLIIYVFVILVLVFALMILYRSFTDKKESKPEAVSSIVQAVKKIAELSTVEMNIQTTVKYKDDLELWGFKIPFGSKKVYIILLGKVKAGVDMRNFTSQDIMIKEKTIKIVLPEPKITSVELRAVDFNQETGIITDLVNPVNIKEIEKIRNEGEKTIIDSAYKEGIIEKAKNNTQAFLKEFLGVLGFSQIEFEIKKEITKPAEKKLPVTH